MECLRETVDIGDPIGAIKESFRATESFDELLKHGANAEILKNLIYIICLRRKQRCRPPRFRSDGLASSARDLADQISRVGVISPAVAFLTYTTVLNLTTVLPDALHHFADEWQAAQSQLTGRGRDVIPQNVALVSLMLYVHEATGRTHYRELVDILEAVAPETESWSESALAQLMHRWRGSGRRVTTIVFGDDV